MSQGQQSPQLVRALGVSLGIAFALGCLAFWPGRSGSAPPRPALTPPITFDALDATKLPPSPGK